MSSNYLEQMIIKMDILSLTKWMLWHCDYGRNFKNIVNVKQMTKQEEFGLSVILIVCAFRAFYINFTLYNSKGKLDLM